MLIDDHAAREIGMTRRCRGQRRPHGAFRQRGIQTTEPSYFREQVDADPYAAAKRAA